MDRPIYLTTKRLVYNCARIDFRNGRIEKEELDKKKKDWEREYNDLEFQKQLQKEHSTRDETKQEG